MLVQRLLRFAEVSARPDNTVRRVMRWMQRNRMQTLTLVLVMLLLSALLVLTSSSLAPFIYTLF